MLKLKLKTQSEIRRISTQQSITVDELRKTITNLFLGNVPANFSLKYEDEGLFLLSS
jgi:hypothetical protein